MKRNHNITKKQGLDILIKSIGEEMNLPSTLVSLRETPVDRDGLYTKVFAYYQFLQRRFPENIKWDGNHFEFTEWDLGSFALNYYATTGNLDYTPAMFKEKDADFLSKSLETVSPETPMDVILCIPTLNVRIPFLDVQKVSAWYFAGND